MADDVFEETWGAPEPRRRVADVMRCKYQPTARLQVAVYHLLYRVRIVPALFEKVRGQQVAVGHTGVVRLSSESAAWKVLCRTPFRVWTRARYRIGERLE